MSSELAAQIRSHRPSGARAYYLCSFDMRYPSQGGFSLEPLTLPFGIPTGDYRIAFLPDTTSGQTLGPLNPATNPNPTVKISSEEGTALAVGRAAPDKPDKPSKPSPTYDPLLEDPEHLRHRVEFEAIRMADQTVKAKHLLTKGLLKNQELGEGFVLNRAWRQETEQLIRMLGDTHRQTLEQSKQTLAHAKETAQHILDASKQTPAPPPDHVAPFLGLVGQVIGLIGSQLNPRGSRSTGDPVVDALVEETDEKDGKEADAAPGNSEFSRLKAELERLKRRLAQKQAEATGARSRSTKTAAKRSTPGARGKPDKTAKEPAAPADAKQDAAEQTKQGKGTKKRAPKQLPAKGTRR